MRICTSCCQRFNRPAWRCPVCGHAPEERDGCLVFAPKLAHATDGFEPEYFDQIASLEDSGHFWFEARARLITWALTRYFAQATTYMEIGCGTGHLLSHVITASPQLEISGGDVLEAGLRYAAARVPTVTFYQMDARQMPFEEEFDVVGAYDVLEHIEEERQVLGEIFRALKPGGGAILTVPQHSFLWGPADEYSRHRRRYTRSGLVETVKAAGFDVIRTTSWVSLLLPALLISRMRERRAGTTFDPVAEFQSSARLNKALAWICGIERTLITRGLSFGAGGSLLLVARKPSVASDVQPVS